MRHRIWGVDKLDAEFLEVDLPEHRRQQRHRMNGGASVMEKTGECEFAAGTAAPAGRGVSFNDEDRQPAFGKGERRDEAVGAGADYDGVEVGINHSDTET
jgi:hypothetical protein